MLLLSANPYLIVVAHKLFLSGLYFL